MAWNTATIISTFALLVYEDSKKQPLGLFQQFVSDLNRTYVFSAGSPMRCYVFGNAVLDLERLLDFRQSCQIGNSLIKHALPISWPYLSNTTVAQPSQSSCCCPLKNMSTFSFC